MRLGIERREIFKDDKDSKVAGVGGRKSEIRKDSGIVPGNTLPDRRVEQYFGLSHLHDRAPRA